MEQNDIMLKIENVSKIYKLGEIGGTTLRDELQRLKAKILHKPDPTKKIGAKHYNKGEKFKALENISFEVKKGERIGIIGHNGAGKSTLLKLISRVTGPTKGKIFLNGRVASMLEVGTGFHPELTGRENIYMNGAILGMTKKEIDAKMEDIIEFSEVRQFIDTPVKRYSSGMYVKLAFSVAAHLDSEIMIMDEVLAVGDMAFQNKCLEKMKFVSEQEDKTILYVSHNMNTIRQLCDRVIVLNHGTIVFDGDTEQGISTYLSNNQHSFSPIIDASTFLRPDYFTQRIEMERVEFVGSDNGFFARGDFVRLKINWISLTKIEKPRIRIIFRNESDHPIGMALSGFFGEKIEIGKHESIISINTNFLCKGKYTMSFIMFQTDNQNCDVVLDHVTRLCSINIIETGEKVDELSNWNSYYYGSIHLPDIIIL